MNDPQQEIAALTTIVEGYQECLSIVETDNAKLRAQFNEAVRLLERAHPPTTPDKDLWTEWLADVHAFLTALNKEGI